MRRVTLMPIMARREMVQDLTIYGQGIMIVMRVPSSQKTATKVKRPTHLARTAMPMSVTTQLTTLTQVGIDLYSPPWEGDANNLRLHLLSQLA